MKLTTHIRRRRAGFSLVEILCVIGIIASLAGLLFPVYQRSRLAAKGKVCLSNVRSVGLSALMYCADFDDRFPYATDDLSKTFSFLHGDDAEEVRKMPLFSDVLLTYTGSRDVFRSPLDTGTSIMENGGSHYVRRPTLYQAVGSSFYYSVSAGMKLSGSSEFLSYFPIFQSAGGHWQCACAEMVHGETSPASDPYKAANYRYSISFGDGHAKTLSFMEWDELSRSGPDR